MITPINNGLLQSDLDAGGHSITNLTGGSGQIKTYVADPNAEGVVPDDQTKPAVCYSLDGTLASYGWNTSLLIWN